MCYVYNVYYYMSARSTSQTIQYIVPCVQLGEDGLHVAPKESNSNDRTEDYTETLLDYTVSLDESIILIFPTVHKTHITNQLNLKIFLLL